jgi:hypothetical protein
MRLRGSGSSIRQSAEGSYVARAEFSPIGEHGGKWDPDFSCSELEKTMARSARESILQTLRKFGLKSRRVAILDQGEVAVWS